VGTAAAEYTASVTPPAGWAVTVTPTRLNLAPGAKASFTVRLTRTDAAYDQYVFGALTWSDGGGHEVRSPIVVRGYDLRGPANVTSTAASGERELPALPGFSGRMDVRLVGFTSGEDQRFSITGTRPEFDPYAVDPATDPGGPGVTKLTVSVPEETRDGALILRGGSLPAGDRFDLYAYDAQHQYYTGSYGGDSLSLSQPGQYTVFVVRSRAAAGTEGDSVDGQLTARMSGPNTANDPKASVSPGTFTAVAGEEVRPVLRWRDLIAGREYIGRVVFTDGDTVVHETQILIQP
jgi:hypothetical protein